MAAHAPTQQIVVGDAEHQHEHDGVVHAQKDHESQAHTHDHAAPTGRRGAK